MTVAPTFSKSVARSIWLEAQGLTQAQPFGRGPAATAKAVQHLGYVQIDTIHVIERCHHHILYTRIPDYKRAHLAQAQSEDKSVFEYWTHALSYVPTADFKYFMPRMRQSLKSPSKWFQSVQPADLQKVLRLIKKEGPISIRDIDDDVLVEKEHPWASRKPSKRALQWGFYSGRLVVSQRQGMLKQYDLTERHFGWDKKPKPASEKEVLEYLLDRALRAQGFVSIDSICYLDNKKKPGIRKLIEARVKKGELIQVQFAGVAKPDYFIKPETLEKPHVQAEAVHLLSPFDPLIIQRPRFHAFFGYDHRFEAYLPKEKRKYGYFALPTLVGDQAVAVIDLKTDREQGRLLMQKWTWLPKMKSAAFKKQIESRLHEFEKFQLGR